MAQNKQKLLDIILKITYKTPWAEFKIEEKDLMLLDSASGEEIAEIAYEHRLPLPLFVKNADELIDDYNERVVRKAYQDVKKLKRVLDSNLQFNKKETKKAVNLNPVVTDPAQRENEIMQEVIDDFIYGNENEDRLNTEQNDDDDNESDLMDIEQEMIRRKLFKPTESSVTKTTGFVSQLGVSKSKDESAPMQRDALQEPVVPRNVLLEDDNFPEATIEEIAQLGFFDGEHGEKFFDRIQSRNTINAEPPQPIEQLAGSLNDLSIENINLPDDIIPEPELPEQPQINYEQPVEREQSLVRDSMTERVEIFTKIAEEAKEIIAPKVAKQKRHRRQPRVPSPPRAELKLIKPFKLTMPPDLKVKHRTHLHKISPINIDLDTNIMEFVESDIFFDENEQRAYEPEQQLQPQQQLEEICEIQPVFPEQKRVKRVYDTPIESENASKKIRTAEDINLDLPAVAIQESTFPIQPPELDSVALPIPQIDVCSALQAVVRQESTFPIQPPELDSVVLPIQQSDVCSALPAPQITVRQDGTIIPPIIPQQQNHSTLPPLRTDNISNLSPTNLQTPRNLREISPSETFTRFQRVIPANKRSTLIPLQQVPVEVLEMGRLLEISRRQEEQTLGSSIPKGRDAGSKHISNLVSAIPENEDLQLIQPSSVKELSKVPRKSTQEQQKHYREFMRNGEKYYEYTNCHGKVVQREEGDVELLAVYLQARLIMAKERKFSWKVADLLKAKKFKILGSDQSDREVELRLWMLAERGIFKGKWSDDNQHLLEIEIPIRSSSPQSESSNKEN